MVRRPGSIINNLLDNFSHPSWFDHWESDWGYSIPSVDIREKDDHFLLEAELPGLEEKDVEITVEDSHLVIRGERQEEKRSEKENYLIRERRATKFERSFRLSDKVDRERIEASFKNGVLTVLAYKRPESKPSKIMIKAS